MSCLLLDVVSTTRNGQRNCLTYCVSAELIETTGFVNQYKLTDEIIMILAQLCYISATLCKLFGARNLHFVILAFPVKKYNIILFQISKESGQPCELMEEIERNH